MNRFCIIAGPRSGSTWLELMIYEALLHANRNTIRLGEFFHPVVGRNENFKLINGMLRKATPEMQSGDFFDNRLNLLLSSIRTQPAVMRIFPQTYAYDYDYRYLIYKVAESDFRCVVLLRNVLDRALSWSLMETTKFIHKFSDRYTTINGDKNGTEKNIVEQPVTIDVELFKGKLSNCIEDHSNVLELQKISNATILNYDSLINDCHDHNIPIKEDIYIHKLRTTPNDKIILNYDELLKIYETCTNERL